jgi:hypothetical protein
MLPRTTFNSSPEKWWTTHVICESGMNVMNPNMVCLHTKGEYVTFPTLTLWTSWIARKARHRQAQTFDLPWTFIE